jgi:hypothetical protein
MMLATTQETYLMKKSVVSSFKLQQTGEGKLHFIKLVPVPESIYM